MKRIVGVVLALLLVVAVSGAWAGDIQGKVQKIDTTDRMLVLDDGTQLWVAEGVAIENIKEGANIKASYEERDGKNVVTNLEVSE